MGVLACKRLQPQLKTAWKSRRRVMWTRLRLMTVFRPCACGSDLMTGRMTLRWSRLPALQTPIRAVLHVGAQGNNGDGAVGPVPMIRVAVQGVSMDLAMLQRSNAIHISIKAERGTMDDLRLMYR